MPDSFSLSEKRIRTVSLDGKTLFVATYRGILYAISVVLRNGVSEVVDSTGSPTTVIVVIIVVVVLILAIAV